MYERPTIPVDDKNALRIKFVELNDGIKVHVEGHDIPFKGMPTEHAINAIAVVKKLLKLQPIQAMWAAIEPHVLKEEFQQPITREVIKMFPSKLGIAIAHAIEYDSAYRYRIQDLLSETTKEKLLHNPIEECTNLNKINRRRDHGVAHKTMRWVLTVIAVLLCIPYIRNRFKTCDFTKLQLDTQDRYWIDLRTDYDSKA